MQPFRYLDAIHPRSLKHLADQLSALVAGRLWLKVLIGLFLGLTIGFLLGPEAGLIDPATGALIGNWLALPGMLFLASVQMIVIPLVFASIILGLASTENIEQLRRLGTVVVLFFVVTTAFAVTLGLWIAGLLKPGLGLSSELVLEASSAEAPTPLTPPDLADLPQTVIQLLPGNPLGSMVEGEMLQVVIFAVIVGVALVALTPTQSKPLLDLLTSLQQVCMTVVRWAMRLAPLAVFGLMARLTSQIGFEALLGMAMYVLTVLIGLALLLVMYLVLLWTLAGERPLSFLKATRELLLLAFSTSSSAAVMPLSIKTAEEKLGVRPSIAQFVIPLGATINMNGTALYQGVATVFLAQVYGIEIGAGGMALIVAMAVGASIGSPATPGVGIVILAMVLSTVGIPPEGVALLMGVDRILDMSRTAINVAGDLTASKLMDRWIETSDATAPVQPE
ncbi:MAG: dicarboxylate/amino acid:cation symporter [Gammaproteobacteria bacterium]|nr:dicarboxylate/amino acid:cation symporter [Gammaproteobacteria bacterium]MDH3505902.1 dicarboxylate/amino acid:cation symporter [Gammaproteobacteria bacterium]